MQLGRSLFLGILSGAIVALSIVPWSIPPLVFVGYGLLFVALTPAARPLGIMGALLVGLASGTTTSAIAMSWLPATTVRFGGFPSGEAWAISMVAFAWHGAPIALAAGIMATLAKLGVRPERVLPAAVAVSFGLLVALFPWRPAIVVLPMLPYVQMVELGGAALVDFAIMLVSCYGVVAFRLRADTRSPAFRQTAAIAVAALALPLIYGLVRLPMVEADRSEGRLVRVGVVQPNVSLEGKSDPADAPAILSKLQRMSRDVVAKGAEVVLWPETAYPYEFPRAVRTDLPKERSVSGGISAPIVFGARTAVGACGRWNSVLALEGGRIKGVVDKVRRLPFAEYIPFWKASPALRAELACPGIERGDDRHRVVEVAGARMGVLNCYEDVLPSRGFRVGRQSPDFLINVTNDMWFGDSFEPFLHQEAARMRSLETRRDLVRGTNTGVSGHISATGAVLAATPIFEARTFVADVRTMKGRTLFVMLGDWPRTVLGLGLLVVFYRRVRAAWRARKARADG